MTPVGLLVAALALGGCGPVTQARPTTAASPSASPPGPSTPPPTVRPAPQLPVAPRIHVPAGFNAYLYASGLSSPTAMAFGPDGRLYVTGGGGTISVVPAPGAFPQVLVGGLPTALGLAWRGADLFVAVRHSILAYRLTAAGLTPGQAVVSGLPSGRHQTDAILALPDGDFLVGQGSTCDVCIEPDSRSAAVLRFHGDWRLAGVVVFGTRNPYGLALRTDGTAFVTINGQDNLGAGQPADELLAVAAGANAGWPDCWPAWPSGSLRGNCAGVTPPVAIFPPHTSADGIAFYGGDAFGREYVNNAFVAEFGANAGGPTGRRLERVVMSGSGSSLHGTVSTFATGFSHPLAVTTAPDGGLLVADFGTGEIMEIWHTG